jgi:hypothetical protein
MNATCKKMLNMAISYFEKLLSLVEPWRLQLASEERKENKEGEGIDSLYMTMTRPEVVVIKLYRMPSA